MRRGFEVHCNVVFVFYLLGMAVWYTRRKRSFRLEKNVILIWLPEGFSIPDKSLHLGEILWTAGSFSGSLDSVGNRFEERMRMLSDFLKCC